MISFLRTVFGCRHLNGIREHRDDGWYWACEDCGQATLLNPRDREVPRAVGQYDERKALEGKKRAERAALQRRTAAARLSQPATVQKPASSAGNIVPMRRAN